MDLSRRVMATKKQLAARAKFTKLAKAAKRKKK